MATLDELKDSIYDWLYSVVPANTPIDWEDGDDTDRKTNRISLRLLQNDTRSTPAIVEWDSDNDNETVRDKTTLTLVVNCWGTAAETLAILSRASLYSSRRFGFNALWKYAGLGDVTPIINLSELETGVIGERHEYRVTLHTELEHVFGSDYADTLGVTVNEGRLGTVIDKDFGGDPHPIPEGC